MLFSVWHLRVHFSCDIRSKERTVREVGIEPSSNPIIVCVFFRFRFFLFFVSLEMLLFPEYFCTVDVLSLYGEYYVLVRFFLPDGVSLPCDHGLEFWHQLIIL